MLTIEQLSGAIRQYADIDEFEDWFSVESWNVCNWGDANQVAAVLAVESVLSRFHFADLPQNQLKDELASAIRPLAQRLW